MSRKTPLYDSHVAAGGRMVDFAGWQMPINYGSQVEEHNRVRNSAGMFDVSHMTVVDIRGTGARDFLRRLLANDVARIEQPGRALYSCMLNEKGGILDDLITYFLAEDSYRTVVNAATREADLDWMNRQAREFDVELTEREDLAMIAVQGPRAREVVAGIIDAPETLSLKPFQAVVHGEYFVARTGYTGEDGFEVLLPGGQASLFWNQLLEAEISPCGLAARDTLRLEAGLNLYGQDMDTTTTPAESNLGWTVAMEPDDRNFIGREALEAEKSGGVSRKLVGLVLDSRGIPRTGCKVVCEAGEGEVTSGTFSPTIGKPIALARVPAGCGETVQVEIRKQRPDARVVRPPFVRMGKIQPGIAGD